MKMGVVAMPPKKVSPAKKISKKVARNVKLKKSKRTGTTSTPATVKVAKKSAVTKAKAKKTATLNSVDFAAGTDMQTAWEEVLKGGASRTEVSARLAAMWADHKTRLGNDKPVSTIMNHVVRRGLANGYRIEQTWRLVKDDGTTPAKLEETTVVMDTPARKKVRAPELDRSELEDTPVGSDVAPAPKARKVAKKPAATATPKAPAKAVKKAAKAVKKR